MAENTKRSIQAMLANEFVRVRALCGLKEGVPRRYDLPPITDDFSHYRQLAAFLDGIGFDVQRIGRASHEPMWTIQLRRGDIPEGEETHAADVALTNFLNARGQPCVQYLVKSKIKGDCITATVKWECGAPGWLEFTSGAKEVIGRWNDDQSHPIQVNPRGRGGSPESIWARFGSC